MGGGDGGGVNVVVGTQYGGGGVKVVVGTYYGEDGAGRT